MLRLQLLKPAQSLIEFEVADFRRCVNVVKLAVALQIGAQRLDFLLRCEFRRRHTGLERYRERSTVFSTKPIDRRRSSTTARKLRRPLTRLRLSATNRIPRGLSQ